MPSIFQKKIARTKEKILRSIGKADRTSDLNLDLYVEKFEYQYTQANKLAKELNKYLTCLKETQKCSKIFFETLKETYEAEWFESNSFYEYIESVGLKWADYISQINTNVQLPLSSYLNEFPDLKKKIDKRTNRLLDYDNARHTLDSVQSKFMNSQIFDNVDHSRHSLSNLNNQLSSIPNALVSSDYLAKLNKLKLDLEDKKAIYEEINKNLSTSLPLFHEKRTKIICSLLKSFFEAETQFYSNCFELEKKLEKKCDHLSNISETKLDVTNESSSNNYSKNDQLHQNKISKNEKAKDIEIKNIVTENKTLTEFIPFQSEKILDKKINSASATSLSKQNELKDETTVKSFMNNENYFQNDQKQKFIFKVKATYPYEGKEVDELTFSKDDIILVIDGTQSENEDLDDGWLIGVHEKSNRRGFFPQNFTKNI